MYQKDKRHSGYLIKHIECFVFRWLCAHVISGNPVYLRRRQGGCLQLLGDSERHTESYNSLHVITSVYPMDEEGLKMNSDEKRRMTFPLRLAISLKDMANNLAQKDGVSLNHFISLAVAEKVSRLESEKLNEYQDFSRRQKIAVAAGVIHRTLYS
jgi:hypothetical protein